MCAGMLKNLPLGLSGFPNLRQSGSIYVDKTAQIYQMASVPGKFFLARPRRFGKSLLVSTLEALFAHGLRDFAGLDIEKLWNDKTYQVVRLDFSEVRDFSDVEDFSRQFYETLAAGFGAVGFEPNNRSSLAIQLSIWLSKQPSGSLVVLIDEYDAPLTAVLDNDDLFNRVSAVMSRFYATLKSRDDCLRFLFLTGVTRFSHTNIFSGFNNLIDISLDARFGTLLGYTEDELCAYFGEHLDCACKALGVSRADLLEEMREWYDGFCFDTQAKTHVYCPWSVMRFLADDRYSFSNYWFSSGGQPNVLMRYLVRRRLQTPLDFDEAVPMDPSALLSTASYGQLDVNVLLHQTGYLSIRSVSPSGMLSLGYPNREVATSMALLYAKILTQKMDFSPLELLDALMSTKVDEVINLLNQVFLSLDYLRYPIRDESTFRACLQILFVGMSLRPQIEVHSAKGRSDLEVAVGQLRWVFELKFAKDGQDVHSLCALAVKQMAERDYGKTAHGKTCVRVALVFDERSRTVADWEVL